MAAETLRFYVMSKAEMREWVEANPERVNDRDSEDETPLFAAVSHREECFPSKGWLKLAPSEHWLSLVVWLLDEKGADVDVTGRRGESALYHAATFDMLTALLDRGAHPTIANNGGRLPLMRHAFRGSADMVARLVHDRRVRATVNLQDEQGRTALHQAAQTFEREDAPLKLLALL